MVSLFDLVLRLSRATDMVSPELSNHQRIVAYITYNLGKELNFEKKKLNDVSIAAILKEESALKLGLKLKKKVAELRILAADAGKTLGIQISVGVCTAIPTQSESINEFIKKVDDAMYQDKKR